jgi:hypothetical protein
VTWTGTGRPEGRQAYHAHEGGLCRPHLWPALNDAPIKTADWLATETQRCLHLLLTGLDLRERLLSREQDEYLARPSGSTLLIARVARIGRQCCANVGAYG